MSLLNPFTWFRKRAKSPGESKLIAYLQGMGWNSGGVNSWAANRHELVNQYRGWPYVAIHAFAETVAEQIPQAAWVETEKDVKRQLRKAFYLTRDPWKRAKRIAKVRSKYLGRMHRKNAMASIQEGDELIPCPKEDRLVKLLKKPNPYDTQWSFSYRLAMWLRLAGGAYIRAIPGNDDMPSELWPIQPNWLRPVGGDKKIIEEWEIQPVFSASNSDNQWGWMMGAGGRDRIPAKEIITIGYPHPQHYLDFYSPQEAGAVWVDCGNAMGRSRVAQFQNMSYPGVVVEVDTEFADPDPEEIELIKKRFRSVATGVANHGEPIVLTKGMTVTPWQRTNLEMDFANSETQNRDQLLALHKTGPSIVGLAEQNSFASAIAARANYYQGTIKPVLKMLGGIYTERLAPMFQDEDDTRQRVIYFDDPTPKDPAQTLSEATQLVANGVKTVNEVRGEYGLEAYPYGGDDPMLPMGLGAVPWATKQEDDWLPPPAQKEEQPQEGAMPGKEGEEPQSHALSDLEAMFGRKNHHLNGNGKPHVEPVLVEVLTKADVETIVKKSSGSVTALVGSVVDQLKAEISELKRDIASRPRGKAMKFQRDEDGLIVGVVEEVIS